MLSYQHIYHAGGPADCHKHGLQAALLDLLRRDATPFLYIDTHAGRGLYDVQSDEMNKLREYTQGIEKLWPEKWPRPASPYRNAVQSLNQSAKPLRYYPGSPWIAEAMRRPQDHLLLYERHPQEHRALKSAMGFLSNVSILHEDGWTLRQEDGPAIGRGLILIDPSYELKDEYEKMARRVKGIASLYPGFSILLWYPILEDNRHLAMTDGLETADLPFLKSEILFSDKGMHGSGVMMFNPPDLLAHAEHEITNWLASAL